MYYFGPWDDPEGALNKHLGQKDDLHAGRSPRVQGDGLQVRDLLNQFLSTKALKNRKKRQRLRLAFDLTLIPYHGQPEADPNEIYRSKAKDGTSHFHAYATAYICVGRRTVHGGTDPPSRGTKRWRS
jgi:hypothetical protein